MKTPTGIVIEVQHSAMTDAERKSREALYGFWIARRSKRYFGPAQILSRPS
jgi:hypothetical protein